VLFLGQNYLQSLDGQNLLFDALQEQLPGAALPQDFSYTALWESCGNNGTVNTNFFETVHSAVRSVPAQRWLRRVLAMRWDMIYTSAVDGIKSAVGPNFILQPIQRNETFKHAFRSKRELHGVFLYGSVDSEELPPASCNEETHRDFKRSIRTRLRCIYEEVLRDYGVLIIEGWDPNRDWLTTLLNEADVMQYESIFLFGVSKETAARHKMISDLVNQGIVVLDERTFAQALNQSNFFEDDEDYEESLPDAGRIGERYKTVTIKNKKGKLTGSIPVPDNALLALDSSVTLIHDELGEGYSYINKTEALLQFMQQGGIPIWPLYNLRHGLYFERDVEQKLHEKINEELKKRNSPHRKPIFLEGSSNSGKTSVLVKIALSLRAKGQYPVIFISGQPQQPMNDLIRSLKQFIAAYFTNRQNESGKWPVDNVIVIWDNNQSEGKQGAYEELRRNLQEQNVVVIGSAYFYDGGTVPYQKNGAWHVPIQPLLSIAEKAHLGEMLDAVNSELRRQFDEISLRANSNNLFYLLHQLTRLSFAPEWQKARTILHERFHTEARIGEDDTRDAIDHFVEEQQRILREIQEQGFAPAWQLQLQAYLKENYPDQQHEPGTRIETDEGDTLNDFLEINDNIIFLNQMLAMAGQFEADLPLGLLLRIVCKTGSITQEGAFIAELLRTDPLLRRTETADGLVKIRFRHPSEAQVYVEKHFDRDENERKELEYQLLCKIIEACRWSDSSEARDTLSLVRRFGPNSRGKFNDQVAPGKDYNAYSMYWDKIARCLIQAAGDEPEAIIVYAHFLRESCRGIDETEMSQCNADDCLAEAEAALTDAIEQSLQTNSAQYGRLLGELCANLTEQMSRQFQVDKFNRFKGMFSKVTANWRMRNTPTDGFTSNRLLDIWLNAMINYSDSSPDKNDPNFQAALSDSSRHIDTLFDVANVEDIEDKLLDKIDRVYTLIGTTLEEIAEKLNEIDNASYLYLQASRCWQMNRGRPRRNRWNSAGLSLQIVEWNLFFLPDHGMFLTSEIKDRDKELRRLKEAATECARKAVKLLEEHNSLIYRSRSAQCIYMMIKAKWLIYTGNLPLEEKQRTLPTQAQWMEIADLCEIYVDYTMGSGQRMPQHPAVLFLRAACSWLYGNDPKLVRQQFHDAEQALGTSWFYDRITLCHIGKETPRQFYVSVKRQQGNKYFARIEKELDPNEQDCSLVGKAGIYILEGEYNWLFDGGLPTESSMLTKPVCIRLNGKGPQIARPSDVRGGIH